MGLRDQAIQAMSDGIDARAKQLWEGDQPLPENEVWDLAAALDGLLGFLREKEGLHNRRVAALLSELAEKETP